MNTIAFRRVADHDYFIRLHDSLGAFTPEEIAAASAPAVILAGPGAPCEPGHTSGSKAG